MAIMPTKLFFVVFLELSNSKQCSVEGAQLLNMSIITMIII